MKNKDVKKLVKKLIKENLNEEWKFKLIEKGGPRGICRDKEIRVGKNYIKEVSDNEIERDIERVVSFMSSTL